MEEFMLTEMSQLPERRLLVALLNRALFDYVGFQEEDRETAAGWLFDSSDSLEPFTFRWVCAQLGLEPESVVARVRHMRREHNQPTQQWFSELQKAVNF